MEINLNTIEKTLIMGLLFSMALVVAVVSF